jgi:hypothetical protein
MKKSQREERMVALFAWASKKWCHVKKGRKIYGAIMKTVSFGPWHRVQKALAKTQH